jgi:ABC-type transport system involved in multi-copper enzyme maturation permease subunit
MHQESDSGSLRSTLISLPQRSAVLAAKAIVIVAAVFITAVLSVFGSAGIRCVVIDCTTETSQIAATPQAASGILWGVVLYWILIALFTYALSVVLRSGLAAMGTVLAMALIVSTYMVNITPLAKFLPDQAGAQLYQLPPSAPGDLGPATGGLVLVVWVVAALVAALVLFRRQPVRR